MKPISIKLTNPGTNTTDIEQYFVEVILGRPSAQCKHFGICKINRVFTNAFLSNSKYLKSTHNPLFAIASVKMNMYLELAFERSKVDTSTFEKYFRKGIFKMEESYIADTSVFNYPFEVEAGDYPVHITDTIISVCFKF